MYFIANLRSALARKTYKFQVICFITEARGNGETEFQSIAHVDSSALGMFSPTRFAVALIRSSDV